MNIIILHGEDTAKAFARLDKFVAVAQKRGWSIQSFDPEAKLALGELLSSTSLFEKDRLFTVKGELLKKPDYDWLLKRSDGVKGNLVISFSSELSTTALKSFPKGTKVEYFPLSSRIYSFFDAFYPGNGDRVMTLFHELLATEPSEMLLPALGRHIRDIYWAKKEPASMYYPDWRKGKLTRQAARFTDEKLEEIIGQFAQIDYRVKTGKGNIADSLDLLVARQLE